jgi:hypothetical protein
LKGVFGYYYSKGEMILSSEMASKNVNFTGYKFLVVKGFLCRPVKRWVVNWDLFFCFCFRKPEPTGRQCFPAQMNIFVTQFGRSILKKITTTRRT